MSGQMILVAVSLTGLWWAGHKTVSGVKKVDHAIAHKLRHPKAAKPTLPATTAKQP